MRASPFSLHVIFGMVCLVLSFLLSIGESAIKAHETFILRELEVGLDHKQLYISLAITACFRAIPLQYHLCPLIPGILLSVEAAFLNLASVISLETSRECD
jgi:hypothetical protein